MLNLIVKNATDNKDIYQKIILLFWVYWSMSDYDEGTKESWG